MQKNLKLISTVEIGQSALIFKYLNVIKLFLSFIINHEGIENYV